MAEGERCHIMKDECTKIRITDKSIRMEGVAHKVMEHLDRMNRQYQGMTVKQVIEINLRG